MEFSKELGNLDFVVFEPVFCLYFEAPIHGFAELGE